jgi:hypothetical protein
LTPIFAGGFAKNSAIDYVTAPERCPHGQISRRWITSRRIEKGGMPEIVASGRVYGLN